MRSGNRSAGYGFVSLSSAEAAQKAVELLDKKELDGRTVIIEVAKPADQKDKEKKQRRVKKRTGRRGSKSVPGEVSEAEANGEASADATKAEGAAANGDAAKPKKKKKAVKLWDCQHRGIRPGPALQPDQHSRMVDSSMLQQECPQAGAPLSAKSL